MLIDNYNIPLLFQHDDSSFFFSNVSLSMTTFVSSNMHNWFPVTGTSYSFIRLILTLNKKTKLLLTDFMLDPLNPSAQVLFLCVFILEKVKNNLKGVRTL